MNQAHLAAGKPGAQGSAETSGNDVALRVERLSKAFGGVAALDEVTLSVPRNQVVGIIGPNGAGKSTLFNIVTGLLRPDSGRIWLRERDITGLAAHRVAAAGLARTFQIARELGRLTVLENVLLADPRQPGEAVWRALLRPRQSRRAEAASMARARALLERVQLWHLADTPASNLSGGQKKLLELARALMTGAKIVMLDEPAAGVNPALLEQLTAFIEGLREQGVVPVIVEHDMDLVAALCDTVYVLAGGQVIAHGPFAEVTGDPRVAEAYLGGMP